MTTYAPYVIKQGDFLLTLAEGFDADVVWNHPKNEPLRKAGRDPHTLAPGDVIYLPEVERKWHRLRIGEVNTFVANTLYAEVTLTFTDRDGKALANAACKYEGLRGSDQPAQTDASGSVKLTRVPVRPRYELVVELPEHKARFRVLVGHMDPITEATGVQKRLQNLGYGRSPLLALACALRRDRAPAAALLAFQLDRALAPTGTHDNATREALASAHRS